MSVKIKEFLYQVRVYNFTNNQIMGVYDDLVEVSYRKQCNKIGMAVLTVPEGHAILDLLADDVTIGIYIAYPNETSLAWVLDYEGQYRDRQITTDNDGNVYYLLFFPSMMEILSRYIVAWPSGVTDRSDFSGQELAEIVNLVIKYNCSTFATTTNGRLRTATVIRSLYIGYPVTGSPVISYSVSGRNVLELLQEWAPLCNFDFDIIGYPGRPGDYYVKQYSGQLGTDRSTDVVFDLALDNLNGANMLGDRLREKTKAIVGGSGTGAARTYALRTGDNSSATNEYEVFVDASTETVTANLEAIGDTRLGELKATAKINASVVSSWRYVYGQSYFHGDLVTVQIGDVSVVRKIDAVDVSFSQNQHTDIRLEFANP